jgi:hypothetical protein
MNMSKMKDYVMDVQEWVNDVVADGQCDFDNVHQKATDFFGNSMAGDIAKDYVAHEMA